MATDEMKMVARSDGVAIVGSCDRPILHAIQLFYAAAVGLSQLISGGCAKGRSWGFMAEYNAKMAIIDIGFIDGYCRTIDLPEDEAFFEHILDSFEKLEGYAAGGKMLLADSLAASEMSRLLFELGFIRGWLWTKPTPDAVSEAFDRLTIFFASNHVVHSGRMQEPVGQMVSDELRDLAGCVAYGGLAVEDLSDIMPEQVVNRVIDAAEGDRPLPFHQWNEPITHTDATAAEQRPDPELNPLASGEQEALPETADIKKGEAQGTSWTPERRAEAAKRATGQRKPPFDEDFADVRAAFDAGISCSKIARKWGCSEQHIRNFLMKHGVDPRRTVQSKKAALPETVAVDPSPEDGGAVIPAETSEVEQAESDENPAQPNSDGGVLGDYFKERGEVDEAEGLEVSDDETEAPPVPLNESASTAPHRLTTKFPDYAGKREDETLLASDWPDIQTMLANGSSRVKIAGDYDVPVKILDSFIEVQLEAARKRRLAKEPPSGEARAPLPGLAGGAA